MTEGLKTYRGNCHCGAYVYEVTLPKITKADGCNCSWCYKTNFVYARLEGEGSGVKWEKGDLESLSVYRFAAKGIDHRFCAKCGTDVAIKGSVTLPSGDKFNLFAINARTFQHGQLPNFWDMESTTYDAADFQGRYDPPKFDGPKPEVEVEGGQFHTGSCHCGAVKMGVSIKPLDKSYKEFMTECNCSFDNRAGTAWVYPSAINVSIVGEENATEYTFNRGVWGKVFCKTCGVYMYGKHHPLPEEEIAKLPEAAKQWIVGGAHLRPINMRTLNGVDLKEVPLQHTDGYAIIQPPYVEP